jgi:hypothetical protein
MATRIVAGTYREVWQEAVPLDGGSTYLVTTGIHASGSQQPRVFGILALRSLVGAPSISASVSVIGGYLAVLIQNNAAIGNSAAWQLDILLHHSTQQGGNDPSAPGEIYVIAPVAAAGFPIPLLISDAFGNTLQGAGSIASTILPGNAISIGNFNNINVGGDASFIFGGASTIGDGINPSNGSVLCGWGSTVLSAWATLVGGISTIGAGSDQGINIGFANMLSADSVGSIIVGHDGIIGEHSTNSILIGGTGVIGDSSPTAILIGASSSIGDGCGLSCIFGAGSSIADTCNSSIIIGSSSSTLSAATTIIGYDAHVGATSGGIAIGFRAQLGTGSPSTVIGSGAEIGDLSPASIAIGGGAIIGDNSSTSIALGANPIIADYVSYSIAIGNLVVIHGEIANPTEKAIAIGYSSEIGKAASRSIAIGADTSIADSCIGTIAIGLNATIGAAGFGSQAYGNGASATTAQEIIFDTLNVGSHGVRLFHVYGKATTGGGTHLDLVKFDEDALVNPLESAMYLLHYDAAGALVSHQVKVEAVTGHLYVTL